MSHSSGTGVWCCPSSVFAAPRGNVRTRDSAQLAELDELTGIDARRRGDALEGLGNRRGDFIEVHACQLSRERHGELRDVLELRFGKGRDDDMLRTDIEPLKAFWSRVPGHSST